MLLLPQHLNLMLREVGGSGERLSWPMDCANGAQKLHHKRSIYRYLAVQHQVVHLLPHPLGDIKRGTGSPLGLHGHKQIHQIAIDIILIPNLGKKHTTEHTMHNVIDWQKII